MKRQIVITLLATALLGTASIALAGDRYRGHNNGHHSYARNHASYNYGAHYYGSIRHYRPYRQYGYGRGSWASVTLPSATPITKPRKSSSFSAKPRRF